MSKEMEKIKEVKKLDWGRLKAPYSTTGRLVFWWNYELHELREDAKKTGSYTGAYKHYDETFQAIFADLNKLLTEDLGIFKTKALYNVLLQHLNSFSTVKGQEGCPMVVDQKNIYEIKFATEFAERIPKIHETATKAIKEDKGMGVVAKKFVGTILSGSSTLTTLLANAKKAEASLPKPTKPKPEPFTP